MLPVVETAIETIVSMRKKLRLDIKNESLITTLVTESLSISALKLPQPYQALVNNALSNEFINDAIKYILKRFREKTLLGNFGRR